MTSGRLTPVRTVEDKDNDTTVQVAAADDADVGGADKLKRIIRRMRIQVCLRLSSLMTSADPNYLHLLLDLGRYSGRILGLPLHRCRFHRRRKSRLLEWCSSPLTRHHTVLHYPFRSVGKV